MCEKVKVCELCEEQPATVLCAVCCKCYCDGVVSLFMGRLRRKATKQKSFPKVCDLMQCVLFTKTSLSSCFVWMTLSCVARLVPLKKLHDSHKVVELSEVSEDNKVFSATKVRERFEGVLKCDNDLDKKITETIESVQKESESIKEKFHSRSERHTRS